MRLQVYDTRARRKVVFEPLVPGRVGMYVCGPTVYDDPHLGHARLAVAFDVIRRSFEALGYRVTYVQNITDVDDKIVDRAAHEHTDPDVIAERYTAVYDEMMRRLGVRAPSIAPKATAHIPEMLKLVEALIDAGFAYPVEGGDVYFAVDKLASYGSLSGRSLDDMRAGERVEPDPRKHHPMDFALWKGKGPDDVSWPSPWGPGRPGWHIECSAMSMRYLGPTFDVHGGGEDLVFPHHENECAQSEAVTGAPLARYWLHNGFITVNEEKMSKSLKNYVTIADVLEKHGAPAVRTLLASVHYRSPIEISEDVLVEADAVFQRFATFARTARERAGTSGDAEPDGEWHARFMSPIADDFNTPEAVAVLHELINEGNACRDDHALATLYATFRVCAHVLGLDPETDWPDRQSVRVAPLVEFLLQLRAEARAAKDFARADAIRDVLTEGGVVVEDKPGGARWYVRDPWR